MKSLSEKNNLNANYQNFCLERKFSSGINQGIIGSKKETQTQNSSMLLSRSIELTTGLLVFRMTSESGMRRQRS